MLIDDTPEYDAVWDMVDEKLKFKPSSNYRGHSMDVPLPFQISVNYAVYGIDKMTVEQLNLTEEKIRKVFVSVTHEGQKLYALDWQHSAFIFDPRNEDEQKSFIKKDDRYLNGEYYAYFPPFIPDGDYYFFIDEFFEFGYLGHPWRQEIWVFGDKLIEKIEEVYQTLGWERIR